MNTTNNLMQLIDEIMAATDTKRFCRKNTKIDLYDKLSTQIRG